MAKVKELVKKLIEAEQELDSKKQKVERIRAKLLKKMKTGDSVTVFDPYRDEDRVFGKVERIDYELDPKKMHKKLDEETFLQVVKVLVSKVREIKSDRFVEKFGKQSSRIFVSWLTKERG